MLVCLCRGLSERHIREEIERGADSVEEIGRRSGAGTDCGSCRGSLRALFDENTSTRPQSLLIPLAAK